MISPVCFIAINTIVTGAIVFLLNLPLIFRKVPMNQLYGIRMKASFESEQRWYDVNAYGGKLFATWSCLIIVAGVAGFFVPARYFTWYAWGCAAVTLLAIGLPAVQTYWWSRKTSR